eukprot:39967-Ditylum_brightwellii.AAC.1
MTNLSIPEQDDVPPPLLPRQLEDDIKELSNGYLKCILFDAMDMMQMNKNVYNPAVVTKLHYPNNKAMQAQCKCYEL